MIQAYKGRQLLSVDDCDQVEQCLQLYEAVANTTIVTNEIVNGTINEEQVTIVNASAEFIESVAMNPTDDLLLLMQDNPAVFEDLSEEATNNTIAVDDYYSATWSDNGTNGLSAGAIVGIVIGVLALLGIIAGVTYYCLEKKKKKHFKSESS